MGRGIIVVLSRQDLVCLPVTGSAKDNDTPWQAVPIPNCPFNNISKKGMTQLSSEEIIIFGGEAYCADVAECWVISARDGPKGFFIKENDDEESKENETGFKICQQGFSWRKGPSLPRPCTPSSPSYVLNCNSFHYFLSTESDVYRLNKLDLTWTEWKE